MLSHFLGHLPVLKLVPRFKSTALRAKVGRLGNEFGTDRGFISKLLTDGM
jgi:hypothetical protein